MADYRAPKLFITLIVTICVATTIAITFCSAAALADTTVGFSSQSYEMNGTNGSTLTIPILRQGDLSGTADVYLNVSGGTAVYMHDFSLNPQALESSPIHFGPGVQQCNVTVTAIASQTSGSDKITILRLISISGAEIGDKDITAVTIHGSGSAATATPTSSPSSAATPNPSGAPTNGATASPAASGTPSQPAASSPSQPPASTSGTTGTPTDVPLSTTTPSPSITALPVLLAVLAGFALVIRLKK